MARPVCRLGVELALVKDYSWTVATIKMAFILLRAGARATFFLISRVIKSNKVLAAMMFYFGVLKTS